MRKIAFLLTLWFAAASSYAQYDPQAKEVLDAMSEKYKKIGAYKADFSYSLVNETEGINEKFTGAITLKGDMYKLEVEDQIVINDNTTVWTYLPDVNEVNIDTYSSDDDELSPSKIYDVYKNGYKYILIGNEDVSGTLCDVVDLIPNKNDSQFFKIKLYISKKDHSLKAWTMFEKSGNQLQYMIKNFNPNVTVVDGMFSFDAAKHPGVEVIDLR